MREMSPVYSENANEILLHMTLGGKMSISYDSVYWIHVT